jgi:hypothetical protein
MLQNEDRLLSFPANDSFARNINSTPTAFNEKSHTSEIDLNYNSEVAMQLADNLHDVLL